MCGKVINVVGQKLLGRQSDGRNRLVFTDDKTYGNGKPRKGELVLGWMDRKKRSCVRLNPGCAGAFEKLSHDLLLWSIKNDDVVIH